MPPFWKEFKSPKCLCASSPERNKNRNTKRNRKKAIEGSEEPEKITGNEDELMANHRKQKKTNTPYRLCKFMKVIFEILALELLWNIFFHSFIYLMIAASLLPGRPLNNGNDTECKSGWGEKKKRWGKWQEDCSVTGLIQWLNFKM